MDDPSLDAPELDVLPPVLFNTWKHHAGTLRTRLDQVAGGGPEAVRALARQLAVVGGGLMDLYTGTLSPRDLSARVIDDLRRSGRLDPEAYHAWLLQAGDYAMLTHPDDGSCWVLRMGDPAGRFVHLHPGRWTPYTMRVRANVLKTAVLVHAHVRVHGGDPMSRDVIDAVRRDLLGLAPLGRDPGGDAGLGAAIELLRGR